MENYARERHQNRHHGLRSKLYRINKEIAAGELQNSCGVTLCRLIIQSLRSFTGESLDRQGIISAFQKGIDGCALPFRQVAERFHFLDSNTHTVYVPYGDGAALVQQLRDGICTRNLYRKLSRYGVSVYDGHYRALAAAGALLTARELPALDENSAVLTDLSLYSDTLGLLLEPETGKAEFI